MESTFRRNCQHYLVEKLGLIDLPRRFWTFARARTFRSVERLLAIVKAGDSKLWPPDRYRDIRRSWTTRTIAFAT